MLDSHLIYAQNAAQVIRSARKSIGQSQKSLAKFLGFSERSLSRIENGTKLPSANQWYWFCCEFGIDPESGLKNGYIDHCLPTSFGAVYSNDGFLIPKRYLTHQGSKVRTLKPFFEFFKKNLGADKLLEYFKYIKIDPDFFVIFDNQLNIQLAFDIVAALVEKGVLKYENVSQLALPISTAPMHGRMHDFYCQTSNKKELLFKLISHMDKYEGNFSYQFIHEEVDKAVLSISPAANVKYFNYKSDLLSRFICEYKKQYLKQFSTYSGGFPVEINELECHFKGNARCLYEIQIPH